MMSKKPDESLSVGEVSRRTGVAVSALHYYEQLGLITSHRTAGNQRRYQRHMIRRISLIQVSKRLGVSLAEVGDMLSTLPVDTTPSKRDWQRISQRWKVQLEAKKRAIEDLQRELNGCIGCGCLSMASCSLLNPQDALGQNGSGPQRLAS